MSTGEVHDKEERDMWGRERRKATFLQRQLLLLLLLLPLLLQRSEESLPAVAEEGAISDLFIIPSFPPSLRTLRRSCCREERNRSQ